MKVCHTVLYGLYLTTEAMCGGEFSLQKSNQILKNITGS